MTAAETAALRFCSAGILPAVTGASRPQSKGRRCYFLLSIIFANGGSQFGDDFLRRLDGRGVLVHVE
jgi:hypothetical protein